MKATFGATILLAGLHALPVAAEPAEHSIAWSEMPGVIATCQVDQIHQSDENVVTITLKNGDIYRATQPRRDDIIALLKDDPCVSDLDWADVPQLVESCEIESVFQAHSGYLEITMKNGRRYETTTPHLDDIVRMLFTKPCNQDVRLGME